MALSDLAVFSEYTYTTMTESVAQQIQLFNAASDGTLILRAAAHQGDYSDETFFAQISGLVRRRNVNGSGAVTAKALQMLVDTMVKVAAGTPPVVWNSSQWSWIQMNEEAAGVALGMQLAEAMLADMLNTAINAAVPMLKANANVTHDISALTGGAELPSFVALTNGAAKFGDRADAVRAWLLHSVPMTKLFVNALGNAAGLFTYGTVSVVQDPFGRRFIVTDAPGLITAGSPTKYNTLGLVQGAIEVHQNNDYDSNVQRINGDENISRSFQAEWTYQLGMKGYKWDKANGGPSPSNAALQTATNWDKIVTSDKDTAGVVVVSQ